MKKIFKDALKIGSGIIIGMSMTAFATTLLTDVYLNEEIKISVNGQVADLRDATTNEKEYPLTYKNRTYIPLRSVATLLGFDVGYVQETNTATVDNKPQETQPEPVREEPQDDNTRITLNTLNANDIPLINKYTWVETARRPEFDDDKNRVSNIINSIYASISDEKDKDNSRIHSQSPFKEDISKIQDELISMSNFNNSIDNLTVQAFCSPDSVKNLRYAYDSKGNLKGVVASYVLNLKYKKNSELIEEKNQELTSIFMSDDEYDTRYAWVCDLIQ